MSLRWANDVYVVGILSYYSALLRLFTPPIWKSIQNRYNQNMALKHLTNLLGDKLHTLPLLVLYLTDGCNSRCAMCDIWRSPRRNMALTLVDELVAAAAELDVRWVLLSGGEAMQHPQWDDIGRRFRERGIYVMLLTNALLLRRQIHRAAGSLDEVIVSLDAATPATYARIRGVDGLEQVIDGIRAAREAGLSVTTRTTVQRDNYTELPGIIQRALAADVNQISFLAVDVGSNIAFGDRLVYQPQQMHSPALAHDDIDALAHIFDEIERDYDHAFQAGRIAESPHKLRQMLRYFRAVNGQTTFDGPRCNAPHISTVIEVDGTIRPCYFLPEVGQIGADGLRAALNTPAAIAMRQAYRNGQRAECDRCVCPLYKGPRALARL
jgi:Fe-coproporphyrin III synthase